VQPTPSSDNLNKPLYSIIQAIGGASASRAAEEHRDASKGGNIMLGGIAFQMAAITVYVACAAEFFIRYILDRPVRAVVPKDPLPRADNGTVSSHEKSSPVVPGTHRRLLPKNIKLMIVGLIFSTLVIFIRCAAASVLCI
jgi:hypothetical protein